MGMGRWNGTRYLPISSWEGSWAQQMQDQREGKAIEPPKPARPTPSRSGQWPIGTPPPKSDTQR